MSIRKSADDFPIMLSARRLFNVCIIQKYNRQQRNKIKSNTSKKMYSMFKWDTVE